MPGDGSTIHQANKFYLPILVKEKIKLIRKEILEGFLHFYMLLVRFFVLFLILFCMSLQLIINFCTLESFGKGRKK